MRVITLKIIEHDNGRVTFHGLRAFVTAIWALRARLAEAAAKGREERWGDGPPN